MRRGFLLQYNMKQEKGQWFYCLFPVSILLQELGVSQIVVQHLSPYRNLVNHSRLRLEVFDFMLNFTSTLQPGRNPRYFVISQHMTRCIICDEIKNRIPIIRNLSRAIAKNHIGICKINHAVNPNTNSLLFEKLSHCMNLTFQLYDRIAQSRRIICSASSSLLLHPIFSPAWCNPSVMILHLNDKNAISANNNNRAVASHDHDIAKHLIVIRQTLQNIERTFHALVSRCRFSVVAPKVPAQPPCTTENQEDWHYCIKRQYTMHEKNIIYPPKPHESCNAIKKYSQKKIPLLRFC